MNRIALTITIIASLSCLKAFASDVTQLDPDKIAQYGIASFNKGDYQTAIRYLSARARMKPEDSNVYYYLGNCYLKTNQNTEAAHMFSACIRMSPGTQAGKYALSALESLSTRPKTSDAPPPDTGPDPAQTAASKDSLMSEKPVDQEFNDAVVKIKNFRQTLKTRVDHVFLQMQDEMQSLQQKNNPTYATDLERLQREAENKIQDIQTKELRLENRLLAPDKIDVRAIPQLPVEKIDDTKTALGSLLDYFKPEKPYDPFATDITPELTSKFMTIKDLFGELSTYQPSTRRLAKQVFAQLKNSIEIKQDSLDQQLYQLKSNLIHDVINIKNNYGNTSQRFNQVTVASFITGAKLPRNDQEQVTPQEAEIAQAVDRSKKRIKELEESFYRDVDGVIAGAKERLGGVVAQTGQMNSQLKKPSGNIQIVPLGTDTYTRNYVNFGDRPDLNPPVSAGRVPASSGRRTRSAQSAGLHAAESKTPVRALKAEESKASVKELKTAAPSAPAAKKQGAEQ
jgi:tetratricopeptide (TPR) repeat protein